MADELRGLEPGVVALRVDLGFDYGKDFLPDIHMRSLRNEGAGISTGFPQTVQIQRVSSFSGPTASAQRNTFLGVVQRRNQAQFWRRGVDLAPA